LIAIVDDGESFRRAATSFIRSLGCAALQFASAGEFLNSDQLHDTDCVISDVQMTGISGIELQDKLIAQGHRLPIISLPPSRKLKRERKHLRPVLSAFLPNACVNKALAGGGV
jgi:FixJ family two-component response regulator